MTNLIKLTALAAVALVATTTIASAAFPVFFFKLTPTHPHQNTTIECRVHDSDFYIINFGAKDLDSGRQISWQSPSTGDDGLVMLPKMLAPGEEVKLADVLSDVAAPGAPCSAAFA